MGLGEGRLVGEDLAVVAIEAMEGPEVGGLEAATMVAVEAVVEESATIVVEWVIWPGIVTREAEVAAAVVLEVAAVAVAVSVAVVDMAEEEGTGDVIIVEKKGI